jgi:Yip1-like protein
MTAVGGCGFETDLVHRFRTPGIIRLSSDSAEISQHPISVFDAPKVILAPRSLFARIEDTGAYGWTLVSILVLVTAIGYLQIQSGLIDAVIAQQVETQKAAIESGQANLIDRIELRERMKDIEKQGEFNRTITSLGVVVLKPAGLLASYLLIAAVLYALVALSGRKPEWHSLMSIVVLAGLIDLVRNVLQIAMVFYYKTLDVDTSLRALTAPGEPSPLAGVDPFRIWFWILVGVGLTITQQLSRKLSIVACTTLCVLTMAIAVGLEFVSKR